MSSEIDLVQKICSASQEVDGKKKLNCAQAFGLAKELGVSIKQIGDLCNEQNIRICNCQLGCFK